MLDTGGFFPRRDLPCWERQNRHTAPCCPFAVTYTKQVLSQALCQLSQPRFSDLITNGSNPINWPNPFLNPFILLPLQKVAPNSLLQGADSVFMDNSFEQMLFSASEFHASLLWIFVSSLLWFLRWGYWNDQPYSDFRCTAVTNNSLFHLLFSF